MQLFMPFYALPTLVTFLAPPILVQIPKTMAIERNPAISVMKSRLSGNFSYSNDLRFSTINTIDNKNDFLSMVKKTWTQISNIPDSVWQAVSSHEILSKAKFRSYKSLVSDKFMLLKDPPSFSLACNTFNKVFHNAAMELLQIYNL